MCLSYEKRVYVLILNIALLCSCMYCTRTLFSRRIQCIPSQPIHDYIEYDIRSSSKKRRKEAMKKNLYRQKTIINNEEQICQQQILNYQRRISITYRLHIFLSLLLNIFPLHFFTFCFKFTCLFAYT